MSVTNKNIVLDISLLNQDVQLDTLRVTSAANYAVAGKLKDIEGTSIYAGKKTEVILMRNVTPILPPTTPARSTPACPA